MTSMTRFEALQLAVIRAGSQEALAELLDVSQPTISNWVTRSKQLPADYVLRVEAEYGVSRCDLRPDIYPRELMVDQHAGDRFCGVDMQARARRSGKRAAA